MGRTTLAVTLKPEANRDSCHVVRIRITKDRVVKFWPLNLALPEKQFNPKGTKQSLNWVRKSCYDQAVYNDRILKAYQRAESVVAELEATGQLYTATDVRDKLTAGAVADIPVPVDPMPGFRAYVKRYIARRGESATTDTYIDADKAFGKFLASVSPPLDDIPFAGLTISFVKEWRQWALTKYKNNTAWLYHSRLKSLYFQALEDVDGLTSVATVLTDPFRRVRIPKQKTTKRRLYEDEIDRLAALELAWNSPVRRARDISLLMYYAHGMRVGDALRLRLSNYVVIGDEHRLVYEMGKTRKPKNVLLPQQAVTLLAPYLAICTKPTDTLFPYLRKEIDAGYDDYRMRMKIKPKVVLIRDNLHKLAELAKIDKQISAHVFRHSFADLARRSKMDVTQIQKALGHDQISTTQGYLEELDQSAVDEVRDLFTSRDNSSETIVKTQDTE